MSRVFLRKSWITPESKANRHLNRDLAKVYTFARSLILVFPSNFLPLSASLLRRVKEFITGYRICGKRLGTTRTDALKR